jgi:hypothetical protein
VNLVLTVDGSSCNFYSWEEDYDKLLKDLAKKEEQLEE